MTTSENKITGSVIFKGLAPVLALVSLCLGTGFAQTRVPSKSPLPLRQIKAAYYTKSLKDLVVTPYIERHNTSVYAQYSIRTDRRDDLSKSLNDNGIPTAIHYPMPLHLQEAFGDLGYRENDFPVSERVSKEILSLPMSPFITQDEQDYIIEKVRGFFKGK